MPDRVDRVKRATPIAVQPVGRFLRGLFEDRCVRACFSKRLSVCALALMLSMGAVARAQPAGVLQGRVMDPTGAAIPGASVLVQLEPSGPSRTVRTDGEGRYRIAGLASGQYEITAQAAGFQTAATQAAIPSPARSVSLDVHLPIATQAQQVVVQGTSPQLQVSPDSNASAVTVSGNNMSSLSNDPDQLQNQIATLGGPSVGAGTATAFGLGFVWPDFHSQRHPPQECEQALVPCLGDFVIEPVVLGCPRACPEPHLRGSPLLGPGRPRNYTGMVRVRRKSRSEDKREVFFTNSPSQAGTGYWLLGEGRSI